MEQYQSTKTRQIPIHENNEFSVLKGFVLRQLLFCIKYVFLLSEQLGILCSAILCLEQFMIITTKSSRNTIHRLLLFRKLSLGEEGCIKQGHYDGLYNCEL